MLADEYLTERKSLVVSQAYLQFVTTQGMLSAQDLYTHTKKKGKEKRKEKKNKLNLHLTEEGTTLRYKKDERK